MCDICLRLLGRELGRRPRKISQSIRSIVKINFVKWFATKKKTKFFASKLCNCETQAVQLNHLQALAGLVEIPAIGIAMYIIMKTGKKWLFCSTFLACGISCFFAAIFEGNVKMLWVKITFVMIGKKLRSHREFLMNSGETRRILGFVWRKGLVTMFGGSFANLALICVDDKLRLHKSLS